MAKGASVGKSERRSSEQTLAEFLLLEDHGDASQRERWEAGVLPEEELRQLAHRVLFAPLEGGQRYRGNPPRHRRGCTGPTVERDRSPFSGPYSPEEWARVQELRKAVAKMPGAVLTVLACSTMCPECRRHEQRLAGRVEVRWGERLLAREYVIPTPEVS